MRSGIFLATLFAQREKPLIVEEEVTKKIITYIYDKMDVVFFKKKIKKYKS